MREDAKGNALVQGALHLGQVHLQAICKATGAFSSPFLCPLNAEAGRTDDMSLVANIISLWWERHQAGVQDRGNTTNCGVLAPAMPLQVQESIMIAALLEPEIKANRGSGQDNSYLKMNSLAAEYGNGCTAWKCWRKCKRAGIVAQSNSLQSARSPTP